MDKLKIGKTIREIRELRKYSQSTLASKIGVSQTHISHIETGKGEFSLEVLKQIAQALNVPVMFLVVLASDKNDIEEGIRDVMGEPLDLLKQLILEKIA